eukprot:TRINITY_DN19019_c0_g1_i1.p1 TRINITY_DN19019_c0_g1~~TRINITY_DN19019_c0_g1_i1.p1  ORF type:complete len:319 (-),score=81.25 TRINITY_DN19019_c0_g1_i1:73-1029(-)
MVVVRAQRLTIALWISRRLTLGFAILAVTARGSIARHQQQRFRGAAKAHGIPELSPCSELQGPFDPCLPDFSDLLPIHNVTAETIEALNQQAFVNEIVRDEDARIFAAASNAAKAAVARAENELREKEKLEQLMAAVAAAEEEKKKQAGDRLAAATASVVRDVALRASEMGRQEQLARDQEIISKLLSQQALNAQDIAELARAKSDQDAMRLSAQRIVANELDESVNATSEDAAKAGSLATQAASVVEQNVVQAQQLSRKAMAAAAQQVMNEAAAVRMTKEAARDGLNHMEQVDQLLGAAYQSPTAFVNGFSDAMHEH